MTENITLYDLESDPILCELFAEEISQINTEEGMFGKCGDHLAWEIKKDDGMHGGTLKIFGFGLMWDFDLIWDEERGTESESPWAHFQPAKVFIGQGVMSIGKNAFYGNPNLKSADASEGVMYIGAHAFEKCIFLESVRLCAGLSVIEPYAFSHCKKLAEITLSKDLKIIEEKAFYDCGCLTSLIIPDQVKFIGEQSFGMDSLSSISDKYFVFEGDAPFISENAFDIYIDVIAFYNPEKVGWKEAVLRYFGARKIIWLKEGEEIPKKVLMCGDNLFWSYKDTILIISGTGDMWDHKYYWGNSWGSKIAQEITTVMIPATVTKIGDGAFHFCRKLERVIFLSDEKAETDNESQRHGIKSIGAYAFEGCVSLKQFTVPDSVTSIGERAFAKCCNLTQIEIFDNVISIGKDAFAECPCLENEKTNR